MTGLAVALVLGIACLALVGPRGMLEGLLSVGRAVSRRGKILVGAALVASALPFLGRPYVSVRGYFAFLTASSLSFLFLLLVLRRFDRQADRLYRLVQRYDPLLLAILFLVLTSAATLFVLQDIPHVTDEAAYQFQAKSLAAGRLFLEAPPLAEFFAFTHTLFDGGRWYGILNPGWPLLLAAGYLAAAPWIVNPLLGALTLLFLWSFYAKAGYDRLESRVAILLVAFSPFVFFLSASYMAHAANLFLFVVFLWAWVSLNASAQARFAAIAGLALSLNILVRPTDALVSAAPFLIQLTIRALRERRWIGHLLIVGALSAAGVGLTLLYNQQLTGDPLDFPMSKYFRVEGLGKFGLGFGADMGTKLHGPEFPGFYPPDAVRVSSYRLTELLRDFNGLPLLLPVILLSTLAWRSLERHRWHALLLTSALALAGVYAFHFYHGIAYGPRHYYLTMPALAIAVGRPLSRWAEKTTPSAGAFAKLVIVALFLHTLIFPYPVLLQRYGSNYRFASDALRDFVREERISDALLFIEPVNWGWKSAFPLNTYPLEESSVVFARDLGERNRLLMERLPGRTYYRVRVLRDYERVRAEPIAFTPVQSGGTLRSAPTTASARRSD